MGDGLDFYPILLTAPTKLQDSKENLLDIYAQWSTRRYKKGQLFGVDLGGRHVNVVTRPYINYMIAPNGTTFDGVNTSGRWQGMIFDIIERASLNHNFTYSVIDATLISSGFGKRDKSGKWSGLLGFLQRGEAVIGAAPFTRTISRASDFDFAVPIWYDYRELIVSNLPYRQTLRSSNASAGFKFEFTKIYEPFSAHSWLLILSLLMLVALLVACVEEILGRQLAPVDSRPGSAGMRRSVRWVASFFCKRSKL